MKTDETGNPCPGLSARADGTTPAPTKQTAPATLTFTVELDRATARYLRFLARVERRTEEMQARYMLEKSVTNAYFAPAVRGTDGGRAV